MHGRDDFRNVIEKSRGRIFFHAGLPGGFAERAGHDAEPPRTPVAVPAPRVGGDRENNILRSERVIAHRKFTREIQARASIPGAVADQIKDSLRKSAATPGGVESVNFRDGFPARLVHRGAAPSSLILTLLGEINLGFSNQGVIDIKKLGRIQAPLVPPKHHPPIGIVPKQIS